MALYDSRGEISLTGKVKDSNDVFPTFRITSIYFTFYSCFQSIVFSFFYVLNFLFHREDKII